MPKIFISYRRDDADAYAHVFFEQLTRHFGERSVFLDVAQMEAGVNFRERSLDEIREADTTLILIGPKWLEARNSEGRLRLDDSDDLVRAEVRVALEKPKNIIPVLLRDAKMPAEAALPPDIRQLAHLNASQIGRIWEDLPRLVARIDGSVNSVRLAISLGAAAFAGGLLRGWLTDAASRASQEMKGQPAWIREAAAGYVPQWLYYAGAWAILYGFLIAGFLIGMRRRLGWRLEEILLVASFAALGAAASELLSSTIRQAMADLGLPVISSAITVALRFAFIWLGLLLSIQSLHVGLTLKAPMTVASTLIVATVGGIGTSLQSAFFATLDLVIQQLFHISTLVERSLVWAPLSFAVLWLIRAATGEPTPRARALFLIVAVCFAADAAIAFFGYFDIFPKKGAMRIAVGGAVFFSALGACVGHLLNRPSTYFGRTPIGQRQRGLSRRRDSVLPSPDAGGWSAAGSNGPDSSH